MLAVCLISGFCVLYFGQKMTLLSALVSAIIGAIFGAATELFTPSEYDTITVPTVIAAVLLTIGAIVA